MPGTTNVKRALSGALSVARSASSLFAIVLFFGGSSLAQPESMPVDPSDWYGPHHAPRPHGVSHPDSIVVDCTHHGDRHGRGPLQSAIDRVRANGTIMIRPPGEGMTCVESLSITRPVRISTFGGGPQAVIEAPGLASCVEANVPLGDAVVFEDIKFIARGHEAPCIRVRAGAVVVRNATIDSRNTDWALDVLDS